MKIRYPVGLCFLVLASIAAAQTSVPPSDILSECKKPLEQKRFNLVRGRVPIFGVATPASPLLDNYATKDELDGLQGLVSLFLYCSRKFALGSGGTSERNAKIIAENKSYVWLAGMAALMAQEITYRQLIAINDLDIADVTRKIDEWKAQRQKPQPQPLPAPIVYMSCVMETEGLRGIETQIEINPNNQTAWASRGSGSPQDLEISPTAYNFTQGVSQVTISRTTGTYASINSGVIISGRCVATDPSKPQF